MLHCRFCEKSFSSMSNKNKHERNFHEDEEDYDSENEEVVSDEEESNEDEEDNYYSHSSIEGNSGDEDESGADSAWNFVIMQAVLAADLPKGVTVSDILNSKELMGDVIKQMARKIHDWKETIAELEDYSNVYRKITKTKDRLMEQEEYSENDASKKSFSERKGLLKRILKSHQDVVEQALHSQNAAEIDEEIEDENVI